MKFERKIVHIFCIMSYNVEAIVTKKCSRNGPKLFKQVKL